MKRLPAALLVLLAVLTLGLSVYGFMAARSREQAQRVAADRLLLYTDSIEATLKRLSHLPGTIALHPDIGAVLERRHSADGFNRYLETIAQTAGGAILYVMDRSGETIAASNHATPLSFVGRNYSFRPYFRMAIEGGVGTHFAIGATTGVPGYFISHPIRLAGKPVGVAVVKIEFDDLLANWRRAGEPVFVTDNHGVIILSSVAPWQFKRMRTLSAAETAEIEANRKFAGTVLAPLEYQASGGAFEGEVTIDGNRYLASSAKLAGESWSLHYLTPLSPILDTAVLSGLLAGLLALLAAAIAHLFRVRAQQLLLARQAREAERIRAVNRKLEAEIATRRQAEQALLQAQASLVQTNRLAALGKMSAAIVHEVNQPVAAIRTYTSSGELLLKKGRKSEAADIFAQIRRMTERLGRITSDLLLFSRRTGQGFRPVDLNRPVRAIARELGAEAQAHAVRLETRLARRPLVVSGNPVRLEQLVSNLLRNAIHAASEQAGGRVVRVTTRCDDANIFLIVEDSGKGMSAETIGQLFEPFFTTKNIGEGVGLGLALCFAIVDEAGGRISAENRGEGGARFTISLPPAGAAGRSDRADRKTREAEHA